MISVERRKRILDKISTLEDDSLLETIESLINEEENIVQFTKEQEEQVLRAMEQVKNGQVVSDKEANKEIQKWL